MGNHFLILAQEVAPRHLISPNLHVIMVHFPLGIFVFGLFLEVFSFLWRKSPVRVAAHWMLLFGGLLAVPAALSGIDAYADVSSHLVGNDPGRDFLHRHILFASWGAGIAAISTVIAMGMSQKMLKRFYIYIPLLVAMIAGVTLMGTGSHFGGEGVYLRGVGVKIRGEKSDINSNPAIAKFEYYVPARSTHVLLAGFAIALGLGALGSSLRVMSHHSNLNEDLRAREELDALNATTEPPGVSDDLTVARSLNENAAMPIPRIPSARFWLLSSLVFLMTLGFGVWLLISQEDTNFLENHQATPAALWQEVRDTATATKPMSNNRRGVHVAVGAVLVVLPLILALAIRIAPRQRWFVGGLCLLMVLVIASEIWLGILLIADTTTEGPLYRFAPDTDQQQSAMVVPANTARQHTCV